MRKNSLLRTGSFILMLWLLFPVGSFARSGALDEGRLLRGGWASWDPYQYLEEPADGGPQRLTGLDIHLTRAILRRAGLRCEFEKIVWQQHLKELQKGRMDIAMGASRTDERESFAYISKSYREEIDVLYVRKGEEGRLDFENDAEMIAGFKRSGFRLGVTEGYVYASAGINDYVRNRENASLIVKVHTPSENFKNLMAGRIDGFILDRLLGSTLSWRNAWQGLVSEHPDHFATNSIHLLLSRQSTSPDEIARINKAISELRNSNEYAKIVRDYMFPVLLGITLEKEWFLTIDIIGTIAFAVSGLLLARKECYSLFGAFVLAGLPAFGGGIMRDLIVNRHPIGLMRTPVYLITVIITLAVGFILIRVTEDFMNRRKRAQKASATVKLFFRWRWVQFFDAMGLAAFAIIGVVIAVEAKSDPLWIWGPLLAVITGVGGGIIRDTVRSDPEISSMKGEFYPEVALIWGLIFSLFLQWQTARLDPDEIFLGVLVCFVGGVITRLAAIRYRFRGVMF